MNATNLNNEEEFPSSDAWLSEQLFAQLKDFNSDFKEKENNGDVMIHSLEERNIEVSLTNEPEDMTKTRLEGFESAFRQKTSSTFDENSEVLDLSNANERNCNVAVSALALVDLASAVPINTAAENQHHSATTFNATVEEMKLLKFLESQPKHAYFGKY